MSVAAVELIFSPPVCEMSPQVNESLSQLYVFTQSFRLHVNWLKTAQQNVSMPSKAAESVSTHLLQLSNLVTASLNQVRRLG